VLGAGSRSISIYQYTVWSIAAGDPGLQIPDPEEGTEDLQPWGQKLKLFYTALSLLGSFLNEHYFNHRGVSPSFLADCFSV
jgi:hypothetical protein